LQDPLPGVEEKEEQAAQNFVDIMFKIHNKIQNIKSPDSNKDRMLGSY
jgi:hypothetical protein